MSSIGNLENLIKLYEYRASKQKDLVDRIREGVYKTVKLPDDMVHGLALGDLNLLQEKLADFRRQLERLKNNSTDGPSINGRLEKNTDEIESIKANAMRSKSLVKLGNDMI